MESWEGKGRGVEMNKLNNKGRLRTKINNMSVYTILCFAIYFISHSIIQILLKGVVLYRTNCIHLLTIASTSGGVVCAVL